MAHNVQAKEKFLEILATTPLIRHACKKIGIHSSTIYRWLRSDYQFRRKVGKALKLGRENITDVAEAALIKKIQEGDLRAIMYFLKHNSKRYSDYAGPPETEIEKTDPAEAFRGPDGKIVMSKKTRAILDEKEKEENARKRRAMGLSDED